MAKSELLGRIRGRRKAKPLMSSEWDPSPDFYALCGKIYQHIIRNDHSSLNGVKSVDMRKYLNWWKLRTCRENLEFARLPVDLDPVEEEAALCILLNAAGIPYQLMEYNEGRIAVLDFDSFSSLMLWNCKIDPYETLKCFNETTQSTDFKEYDDKKIDFQSMPRSHLPETPDIRAQRIFNQWKSDVVVAVRRQHSQSRSHRRSRRQSRSRSRSRSRTPSPPRRRRRHRETTAGNGSHSTAEGPSSSRQSLPAVATPETTVAVVDTSNNGVQMSESPSKEEPSFNWRTAAWTLGSRALYEALGVLGREHSVRTEERQLNMRLAATTAESNQQFWGTVATWGAWSAHTALQFYFGAPVGNSIIPRSP